MGLVVISVLLSGHSKLVRKSHLGHPPVRERLPAGISGRVTGSHKLDALKGDPHLVGGAVEAAVLQHLT